MARKIHAYSQATGPLPQLPGCRELIDSRRNAQYSPSSSTRLPPIRDFLLPDRTQQFCRQADDRLDLHVLSNHLPGGEANYIGHSRNGSHASLTTLSDEAEFSVTQLESKQSSRRQSMVLEVQASVYKKTKMDIEAERRDLQSMFMAAIEQRLSKLELDGKSWAVDKTAELGQQNKRNFGGMGSSQLSILSCTLEVLEYLSHGQDFKRPPLYVSGMDPRQLCSVLEERGLRDPKYRPDFSKRTRARAEEALEKKNRKKVRRQSPE